VSAQYPPEVIIVEPPSVIIVDHAITATIAFTYPNGEPVNLADPHMTVRACGDGGCIQIIVYINPDGSFSVPVTPELTGTVTLWIVANSLTDEFGNTFPAVDTQIATITVTVSSVAPPEMLLAFQYETLPESAAPRLSRVAQPADTQRSPLAKPDYTVPGVLAFLALAGAVMMVVPNRRNT
jgi:hypothetical protein